MAVNWVDRVPTNPNRMKITPETGSPYYATVERADNPSVEGTPVNARNLNAMQDAAGLSANKVVYVSTAGSDSVGDGTVANPYATINKAIATIPQNLNGFTGTIHVAPGIYNDEISVWGFHGGTLFLTGDVGAGVSAKNLSVGQTAALRIENINLTLTGNEGYYVFYAVESVVNQLSGKITINGGAEGGVYANTGAFLHLNDVDISNTSRYCITSSSNSKIHVQNAVLSSAGTGVVASYGGVVSYQTIQNNAAVLHSTYYGGRIYSGSQTSIPNY